MPFEPIIFLGIICIVLAILILIGYIGGGIVAAIILGLLGLFLIGGRSYTGRNRM